MEKLNPDWLKINLKSIPVPKKPQEPKTPTYDVKSNKNTSFQVDPSPVKEGI